VAVRWNSPEHARAWNFRSTTGFTALGLQKHDGGAAINGVVFIAGGDMAEFDLREVGYTRLQIQLADLEVLSCTSDDERLDQEGGRALKASLSAACSAAAATRASGIISAAGVGGGRPTPPPPPPPPPPPAGRPTPPPRRRQRHRRRQRRRLRRQRGANRRRGQPHLGLRPQPN
jgi:hypothetical protein